MKKFLKILSAIAFVALVAFVTATLFSGCTSENAFSFEYNFNISGHAVGDVDVTFPGGKLALEGETGLAFTYGKEPMRSQLFTETTLEELYNSDQRTLNRMADVVSSNYDEAFTATTASGTYYFHIVGSVREQLTGVEVKIDKILTNEADEPLTASEPVYKTE